MSLLSANLEAFLAVARIQTVQGAAGELGLTQTGVTQRIRSLEKHLSATLFIRSRRGMRLTSEGEALLHYCHAAQELEGRALAQIQKPGKKVETQVSISGPTSLMTTRVVPACVEVAKRFPGLALGFEIDDIERRADGLRRGSAHLAVLPHEQVAREMDSKVLKPERYVLVGPPA
jgi:LysR family transcriptional regulator (chromosome initiation inhibitor)